MVSTAVLSVAGRRAVSVIFRSWGD